MIPSFSTRAAAATASELLRLELYCFNLCPPLAFPWPSRACTFPSDEKAEAYISVERGFPEDC